MKKEGGSHAVKFFIFVSGNGFFDQINDCMRYLFPDPLMDRRKAKKVIIYNEI